MATVKFEICFDSGQFVGGAKKSTKSTCRSNLRAKKFANMINFAHELWKILE